MPVTGRHTSLLRHYHCKRMIVNSLSISVASNIIQQVRCHMLGATGGGAASRSLIMAVESCCVTAERSTSRYAIYALSNSTYNTGLVVHSFAHAAANVWVVRLLTSTPLCLLLVHRSQTLATSHALSLLHQHRRTRVAAVVSDAHNLCASLVTRLLHVASCIVCHRGRCVHRAAVSLPLLPLAASPHRQNEWSAGRTVIDQHD